jgi:hypothetical protein
MQRINALPTDPSDDRARHASITDRIQRVIQRGRESGEFDSELPSGRT